MFSIVRRDYGWVLRAGGADVMVVGSKAVAKTIVRQAVAAGKMREAQAPAPARGAPRPARRRSDLDTMER